jgi:hypothetical protein
MANFNLADYEPVDSRIRKFWHDNPDGSIITEDVSTDFDRSANRWVFKATIYVNGKIVSTGYASEIDGQGHINRGSCIENVETSCIGRGLANFGYSGNKRASREEMEKVQRGESSPKTPANGTVSPHVAKADKCYMSKNLDGLRAVYGDMQKTGAPQKDLEYVAKLAQLLKEPQESEGLDDSTGAHA